MFMSSHFMRADGVGISPQQSAVMPNDDEKTQGTCRCACGVDIRGYKQQVKEALENNLYCVLVFTWYCFDFQQSLDNDVIAILTKLISSVR
jgi:hypothetical protein